MRKEKEERKKWKRSRMAWARDKPKKKKGKTNPLDQWLQQKGKKLWKGGGKKLLLQNFPYLLCGYFGNKLASQYHAAESVDVWNRVMDALARVDQAFIQPFPSLYFMDILFGIGCGIALKLAVYWKGKHAKKYRHGMEYGSARWGNEKDIEPYMDEVFENNVILTETEGLMMSGRPKEPKYARNKNILVIGGSGSGKTRFFVKPNLMQMHSSYVVTEFNADA